MKQYMITLNKILTAACLTFFAINSSSAQEKMPSKKVIGLIRHGESRHNIEHEFNSNPLHPNYQPSYLTKKGIEQIKAASEDLKKHGLNEKSVDMTFVSPMPRTQQSANIIATCNAISWKRFKFSDQITEVQYGDHEGQDIELWKASKKPFLGESYESQNKRIKEFVIREVLDNNYEKIVIVSHAAIVKGIADMLSGAKKEKPQPGSATILTIDRIEALDRLSK